MERWESRYTHSRSGGGRVMEHGRADRVKMITIILLAVALIAIGIVGGRAIKFQNDAVPLTAAVGAYRVRLCKNYPCPIRTASEKNL